ncbi:hypothetical protein FRC12_014582 [Ceratobasidium sp. 428]|nr:hypothetical protein FRC12_014582 [Ceratobasidium sp. 428]
MSKAEGMRHFKRKISKIKQWTGRESKELMKQFLPAVVGSSCDPDFVELVCAALDFMYYAHSPELMEEDLEEMEQALKTFNRLWDVIIRMKIFKNAGRFDGIPKLHMLTHYADMTRQLGAPDSYNTESPEHLHIEYAKTPYCASNKVRPTNQMVKFIQRQETRIRMGSDDIVHVKEEEEEPGYKPDYEQEDEEYKEREEEGEDLEGEGEEEELNGKGTEGECDKDLMNVDGGVNGEDEGAEDDAHYPLPVVAMAKNITPI